MPLALPIRPIGHLARRVSSRHVALVAAGGVAIVGTSPFLPSDILGVMGLTSGMALILLASLAAIFVFVLQHLRMRDRFQIAQIFADSDRACLLTDIHSGAVLWANDSAKRLCEIAEGAPIGDVLAGLSATPNALAARLQDKAIAEGNATHQTQAGPGLRHYRITALSHTLALWCIEDQETIDPRDSLPLDLAQFLPDGTVCYLSPGLRALGPERTDHIGTWAAQHGPKPGQIGRFALLPDSPARPVMRLPETHDQPDTLIFLPLRHESAGYSTQTEAEHAALEQMPVALAHIASDGRFLYTNHEARRLLRLRTADGAMLSDMFEGLGRPVMEWLSDVASGRLVRATEVLRLSHDDAETYLKVTLTLTENHAEHDVVAVLSDVTELKSLEAKFTQSQKMQAIGQLAGGVAHDFNNLLTAISGHCDLLLLRHDRSDLEYPDLMQIQQNTNRAAALVRQLLALSRQQTLKFVTLDLGETMSDVIHLLNRLVGEKITLTLRQGHDVAPIRADKRQFEQVLVNLVVNARDALPMGGEIRIETEAVQLEHGSMREQVYLPAGNYTLIRISDDGVGIPVNLLPNVFDPFFTTKRPGEGTGLGLSTVYGIVKQFGGYIFVDSEEGVGTTFTLYFAAQDPVAVAPAKTRQSGTLSPTLTPQRALVLLVEDEAPVRSFAARALELQGHRVIEADCGEAALDILSNPEIRPDFFVTDVIMPGLDGPGWIMQVRDRFPDTPVLFMSGYAEDSRVAAQARISNASFLGKPFSLTEFTATVHAQLQRRSAAA